jgi:hypothetical protein
MYSGDPAGPWSVDRYSRGVAEFCRRFVLEK